jgi:alkyl hydroperoxide reductase subunit AhpC
VFIISPAKKLMLSMTYPMNVGRNFAEVLRALDGLQTANGKGVATPADWQVGEDVIIPTTVKDDAAREKFGAFTTVFPYLRTVKLKD